MLVHTSWWPDTLPPSADSNQQPHSSTNALPAQQPCHWVPAAGRAAAQQCTTDVPWCPVTPPTSTAKHRLHSGRSWATRD